MQYAANGEKREYRHTGAPASRATLTLLPIHSPPLLIISSLFFSFLLSVLLFWNFLFFCGFDYFANRKFLQISFFCIKRGTPIHWGTPRKKLIFWHYRITSPPLARNLDNLFHLLEDSVNILLKLIQFFVPFESILPQPGSRAGNSVQFPQSAASPICAGLHKCTTLKIQKNKTQTQIQMLFKIQ